MIKQLYTDKLNNNYTFSNDSQNTGKLLIKIINILNLGTNYILDENSYNNTSDKLYNAFKNAISKIVKASEKVYPNFLVALMEVENPAYFIEGDYSGYGTTAPTGFFTKSDLDSVVKIEKTTVTDLSLKFDYSTEPGF